MLAFSKVTSFYTLFHSATRAACSMPCCTQRLVGWVLCRQTTSILEFQSYGMNGMSLAVRQFIRSEMLPDPSRRTFCSTLTLWRILRRSTGVLSFPGICTKILEMYLVYINLYSFHLITVPAKDENNALSWISEAAQSAEHEAAPGIYLFTRPIWVNAGEGDMLCDWR